MQKWGEPAGSQGQEANIEAIATPVVRKPTFWAAALPSSVPVLAQQKSGRPASQLMTA